MILNMFKLTGLIFLMALSLTASAQQGPGDQESKRHKKSDGAAMEFLRAKTTVKPMDLDYVPTREDLIASGQLGGGLVATALEESTSSAGRTNFLAKLFGKGDGRERFKTGKMERQETAQHAFGVAIQNWNKHHYKEAARQFEQFMQDHPDSPWAGEAELHKACEARFNGRYTEANVHFENLIGKHGKSDYGGARLLADKAQSRLAEMRVIQNDFDAARALFSELQENSEDWRLRTYAANWLIRLSGMERDRLALLDCGTRALAQILRFDGKEAAAESVLAVDATDQKGFNLKQLRELAQEHGYRTSAIKVQLDKLDQLPLPAIIQIDNTTASGTGHYWLLEKIDGDLLTLFDAQLPQRFQQTKSELAHQWAGNVLVFHKASESSDSTRLENREDMAHLGKPLTEEEQAQAFGGCCGVQRPESDQGDPHDQEEPEPEEEKEDPCAEGAPRWSVNMVNMNFFVKDVPLWYSPDYGPKIKLALSYNAQSAIAQYEIFGNKWSFNYGSYIVVDPGGMATVFMADGARYIFTPTGGGNFDAPFGKLITLVETAPQRFELRYNSGMTYIYDLPQGTASLQPFLVGIRDRHNQEVQLEYNSNVELTKIIDATGQETVLHYFSNGLVEYIEDPFGRTAHFGYDTQNNLTSITDMAGFTASFTYDQDIYMESITDAMGTTRFKTEPAGGYGGSAYPLPDAVMWANYRITVTNARGYRSEYYYNGGTGVSWYVSEDHYRENILGQERNVSSAVPKTIYKFKRFSNGSAKIAEILYPDGTSEKYAYQATSGLLSQYINRQGLTTQYLAYNNKGQLVLQRGPDGLITSYAYTPNGLDVKDIVTPLGTASFNYDAQRNVKSFTTLNGDIFEYDWTTEGKIDQEEINGTLVHDYVYNTRKRLQTIRRAGQNVSSFTYDTIGRVDTSTGATGVLLDYAYNNLNSITEVAYPDGKKVTRQYNRCPRMLDNETSRSNRTTTYDYTQDKLVKKTTFHDASTVQQHYQKSALAKTFVEPNKNETGYSYDEADRLERRIYADGTQETYAFDKNQIKTFTDARGVTTTYVYDNLRRLDLIQFSDGTPEIDYVYDTHNRIQSVTDALGTTSYTYYPDGKLQTQSGPWPDSLISYTYDAENRLLTTDVQGTGLTEYNYDLLGRLDNVEILGDVFDYQYTGVNPLPHTLLMPNGLRTEYGYNTVARLNRHVTKNGANQTLNSYVLGFNAQDEIGTVTETEILSFVPSAPQNNVSTHSPRNQLEIITEPAFSHTYDQAGNRTNGLTKDGFIYQASYDARNLLTSVEYTDASAVTHRKVYTYGADRFLGQIQSYQNGTLVNTTRMLRSFGLDVQERDETNAVQRHYTWGRNMGGGIGGLLKMQSGQSSYYYAYDFRGNVTGIYNVAGTRIAAYGYDEFGNQVSSGSAQIQPFGFSTKRYDEQLELVYFGYRFYDPRNGVWITSDPIGLAGGSNSYAYVGGNPLSLIDPLGLREISDDFVGPPAPGDYRTSDMTHTKCGKIPPAPPGVNIDKNIAEASEHWDPYWFKGQVKNRGPWDFKQQGRLYEDFGNFHYGATGTSFGFSRTRLLREAGRAQQAAGTSSPGSGSPGYMLNPWGGSPPYGDDPYDQQQINSGVDYCECAF